MKSNIQEVKTINVRLISDKPVRKTPYQVKGVIMKEHPDSDITPMLNGNYREKFLYPRVQVKILNEEIYLIGIAEGVDPIKSILPKLSTLNFGNITFEITDTEVDEIKNCFRKNSKSIKYQFISPWFALNQKNGKKYRSLNNKDRTNYLNKLLQQNIIFISKEMDVEIDKNISTKLNLSSLSPQSINEYSWGGFIGEFSVNL
ncbi:MAG: CRISPR-associated endonuclease Cas6, partial [Candidatus Neomarinimicrobiota bacterium]|nr:CRISPR-associated endonuclease Cas6 [Candidatus Neomarinimicrobiota bacterium]